MPLIPRPQFDAAQKRMKLGLHPAVLAALERSMLAGQAAPPRPRENVGMVDLGTGTNPGRPRPAAPRGGIGAGLDPLAGQQFHTYLQGNADTGKVREVHVYGTGQDRQVRSFNRQVTPQLQQQIGSTLRQQLSNTATAEDKLLALAHRATLGQLARPPLQARRFSRKPGPMQRY
jgi:hypothetical protein